jgi:hypothetical protein
MNARMLRVDLPGVVLTTRGGRAAPRLDAGWQTVERQHVLPPRAKSCALTALREAGGER